MRSAHGALLLLCGGCFVDAVGAGSNDQGAGGQGAGVAETTGAMMATGGGGNAATGGGGGTTTGMGGEGGCSVGCEIVTSDSCESAGVFNMPADSTVTWSDTTVGATDDLKIMGIAGLTCGSGGVDVWIAVRATAAGWIQLSFTPADEPAWGSNLEKATLHVRTGCNAADPAEVLACKQTDQAPVGQARTQVFAQQGDVFYVGVDGRGAADMGSFDLEIQHWTCGNGTTDPLEQCDSGPTPSASCSGCLSTAANDSCGVDDADTFSFWNAMTRRCYVFEAGAGDLNFFDARELCVESGGDLVSFELNGEQAAFDLVGYTLSEAWVGLEDFERDGTYNWLAGGVFSAPWAPDEPDNTESKPRCAFMLDDNLLGNYAEDTACDDKLPELVCELRGDNP